MIARFSRWTLALLIALVAVGASSGSVSAAPAKPAPSTNTGLSRSYKVEQNRLKVQEVRLKNADRHAGKFDALIARLKAKGQDTAALEQAVATFRAEIVKARAEWQSASATLSTHAGFDAAGKVTDADQARATLKDAHSHMEQAHVIAHAAYVNLHAAFVTYRKTHREVKEPLAPLAP